MESLNVCSRERLHAASVPTWALILPIQCLLDSRDLLQTAKTETHIWAEMTSITTPCLTSFKLLEAELSPSHQHWRC